LAPEYLEHAKDNYARWRLQVDGLVMRPTSFSLAELRAMGSRTQITRHDCVEGWSCIGSWMGTPLSAVLDRVTLRPEARSSSSIARTSSCGIRKASTLITKASI
jgi:DMSO/TMAO reductase YedYZ molybdopterin-dependent catalytic subunit